MSSMPAGAPAGQEPLRVGALVRRFLPAFLAQASLPDHSQKVLRRLSQCHTGELGWCLWQCQDCHKTDWQPNGCGDRHCPECQGQARQAWLEKQRRALLPVRYYHWVFTLPAVLRPLVLQNQRALYELLFESAGATLLTFGQQRLGARLGITALLHTWGQNLMPHPHLHCLVTGGGLVREPDGSIRWQGPKQARYLFPVRAVGCMFAGKFLAGLQRLRAQGQLELLGQLEPWREAKVWQGIIDRLHRTQWVVFGKGSVVGPEAVLDYLGRYTHRVAITNARLVHADERTVTFGYKDYRQQGQQRQMTLNGVEFVRRLSCHVLPNGFTKIRHYGILGNNQRTQAVPVARRALEDSPWRMTRAPKPPPPAASAPSAQCPCCKSHRLTCLGRLDGRGRFTLLQVGVMLDRFRAASPPSGLDSS